MTPLEQLNHSIINDCADAIISKTIQGTIVSWNAAAERLFVYSAHEVLGHSVMTLVPPDLAGEENAMLSRLKSGERITGMITERLCKDGRRITVTLTISPLFDAAGNVIGACTIARPCPFQAAQGDDKLLELAFHDALTKLANRTLLRERLTHVMASQERSGMFGGILLIDLDDFKVVNDQAGHNAGDRLLQICAHRLTAACRETDTVTRWGGDEFVVLVDTLSTTPEDSARALRIIGEKFLMDLRRPYVIAHQEFFCPPSIGGGLFQGMKQSIEKIIHAADQAMYAAKRNGKNGIHLTEKSIGVAAEATSIS